MQKISNIKTVHIELTDKCQAQCPMCARNFHGGATRPFIQNKDISLDQFKKWFPKKFLLQLNNFYSCGNYGDPAFARECLEIFSYIRDCNPTTRLAIHTNGGMRNKVWWSDLAKSIGTISNSEVVFAVDGFKGKHELYRKNTKFDKVIENMTSFINAGGVARVDSLVFKHNEDDIEDLEKFLYDIGVESVNFIGTTRFYSMKEFDVLDNQGNLDYKLYPTELEKFRKISKFSLESMVSENIRAEILEQALIEPSCVSQRGIYVDPSGDIFPCCWFGGESKEQPIKEILPIHYLRNLSVSQTKNILNAIGVPNCETGILSTDGVLFENLENFWEKDKCLTCVRQCSKAIYEFKK